MTTCLGKSCSCSLPRVLFVNSYCWQTCRALQKRFGEHYRRMKKPKPIDTFLYQHFKLNCHSPNDVLLHSVEKLTYERNSSSRFKIIKRHETE